MEQEQKMQILQDLIALHSVNGDELPVANYLKNLLDKAGIKNKILPLKDEANRANLVAELGSGKPVLVISGHMDTVDVNQDNWKTDPFKLTKKGDKLYGRGTTDMKAGLAAMVIAMIELKESGAEIAGTIRLLATAGEEVGQPGAEELEKQGYVADADALLIGEPSGLLRTIYANKGELDLTISSEGKAAHSSMPFLGNNAVEHLLNVLTNIKKCIKELTTGVKNDVLGETVFNIDTIKGGNQVNAIPSYAQAELNLRTIPELDNPKILQAFQQVIDDYNNSTTGHIKMTVDMDIVPIIGDRHSKLVKVVQDAAQPYVAKQKLSADQVALMKKEAQMANTEYHEGGFLTEGVSGGTDGSKFLVSRPMGFAYLMYGPGSNTPHQDNEYVSEQMYLDFIDIFKDILVNFGK
ncbi:ArgE/DapE family deacylase [Lactobacillus sp. ESL0731]|uniref:ArgE/DapE family deacylase n=1 Tax=unclassified Lactobacillus TaxID=2620435 RepID=UPI0023F7B345|nr:MULTISPECIES: ArgE/DapE family deacylase [unclassified Lactobacillus]WEV51833.1 ArgE/DapE family deacylase [Lactobacillus sp. ESL0700]WEV62963.1 ArgE/DapE family deacylase [Lactobacillus sp. ESL0731]